MRPRNTALYAALAGAAAVALVVIPSASSTNGDNFIIGSTANVASSLTELVTTSSTGLEIYDGSAGAIPIYGLAGGSSGASIGVDGETNSTGASAYGVRGVVAPTSAGGFSAGVRGMNNSTGSEGIGVFGTQAGSGWGGYFTVTGAGRGVNATAGNGGTGVAGSSGAGSALSYGVQGYSGSTAANATGVYGLINSSS